MDNLKIFITTPIYYANGLPHIGHFLTTTAADVVARYYRNILKPENVFFTTGLDEHGTTVEQSAIKEGYTIDNFQNYVDKKAAIWEKAFKNTNISYDYFARTTNAKHIKFAQDFIQKLIDNNCVYKGKYTGKYCNGCEKFLTLSDLNEKGFCPLHRPDQVVEVTEDNYFFKLSEFAPKVKKLIEKDIIEITPENKKLEILSRLSDQVEDISISRPKDKVAWGIEFPKDDNQTVYVWVEALLNYRSTLEIAGKKGFEGNTYHFLAKDISWFHNVIWPAMLLATKDPLFKGTFVHSFFLVDGAKISKSKGNVITPDELVNKFGVDGARYLVLSHFPFDNDSDINFSELITKYNADLANGIGNLVARVAALAEKSGFEFPVSDNVSFDVESEIELKKYNFNFALKAIWNKIKEADQLINYKKVWTLTGDDLKNTLSFLVEDIRQIAVDLQPFLPETAQKIDKQFGEPKIKSGKPLFPRL